MRRFLAAGLAVVVLALAACGDDEGSSEDRKPTSGTTTSETAPSDTGDQTQTARDETETAAAGKPGGTDGTGGAAPEDQPGGAGDEEPASSQAVFTGRGGVISPKLVRVPPFIAIRVELRSSDGNPYTLRGGGRSLSTDADIATASSRFAGLRPGKRLVLTGPSGRVAVEASAEPGP